MVRLRYLLLLVLSLVPCCGQLAHAQIKLAETKIQTYVGFENPRVVNGVLLAGPNSKPMLANVVSLITVEKAVEYKYFEVEAERIPSLETADLEEVEGGYRFKEGTPPGTYRVTARGFDPERGMANKRLTVEVTPAPTPGPVDPIPDNTLSAVSKESREALKVLVGGMAANFDTLAAETKAGKFKTVLEAGARSDALDLSARGVFKQAMAKVMQPKLGSDVLPGDAAQTFTDIAIGFKGVR